MKHAHVVGRFLGVVADTSNDADSDPDQIPLTGTVTLTPQVAAILDTSTDPPATILPTPIVCTLDADGDISHNGTKGVTVLASTDPDTNPTNWTYNAAFNLSLNKTKIGYNSFAIELPPDVTTDLTLVARVPQSNGIGVTRGVGVASIQAGDGALVFELTDRTVTEVPLEGVVVSSVNGQSGAAVVGDVRIDELTVAESEARAALDALYADKPTQDTLVAEVSTLSTTVDERITTEVSTLETAISSTAATTLTNAETYADEKVTAEVTRADTAYAPANVLSNAVTSVNGQKGAVSVPVSDDATVTALAKNSGSQLRTEIKTIATTELATPLASKLDKVEAASTYATNTSVTTELNNRVNPLVDQRLASDTTIVAAAEAAVGPRVETAVAEKLAGGITTEVISVMDSQGVVTGATVTEDALASETVWRQTTETGHMLPLGYQADGHLDSFARKIFREDLSNTEVTEDHPDYAKLIVTSTNRLLMGIRWDGTVEIPGLVGGGGGVVQQSKTPIYTDAPYTQGTDILPVYTRSSVIAGWGSSSMAGIITAMNEVATRLGVTHVNRGKGSEQAEQIAARQGARPYLAVPKDGSLTIPASGTIAITVSNGSTSDQYLRVYTGTWAGVHGTVKWDTTQTPASLSFTRTSAGDPVTLEGSMPIIPEDGQANRDAVQLLWMGKNNTGTVGADQRVIEMTDQCHDWLAPLHKRCLVMGHFINYDQSVGGTQYNNVLRINEAHAKRYGQTYIDVEGYTSSPQVWVDAGITPTQEDLDDQAKRVIPHSLAINNGHFNATGYTVVANYVEKRMRDLGWY